MTTSKQKPKRIWLLLSDKLGDNTQVEIIAKALSCPYEVKRIVPKKQYVFGKPTFQRSLYHIDIPKSDVLEPPWPDLIITVGRRPSMAALWIKDQSEQRTKIVLIGRPRRWLERFDLVISPIQYRVPSRENVCHLGLPLTLSIKDKIADAYKEWESRLEKLPRPVVTVLVGGPTRPYIYNDAVVASLVKSATELSAQLGGTIYVSTSRRTPERVVEKIANCLPENGIIYRWGAERSNNPYLALLHISDYFIVTGDSISMMMEVVRQGRPLAILSLPSSWIGNLWQKLSTKFHPGAHDPNSGAIFASLGRFLYRIGWVGYPRDLSRVHSRLIESGYACKLGDPFPKLDVDRNIPDERDKVVERIKRLLFE